MSKILQGGTNENPFFLSFFMFSTSHICALELDITPARQDSSFWCWAAACEMVLYAYGKAIDQYDCAAWAVSRENRTVWMTGANNAVDQVLIHFGGIYSKHDESTLYESYIIDEIDDGKPIIAGISFYNVIGHMVIIRGYTGSGGYDLGNVIYNNPGTGKREERPYDEFTGPDDPEDEWYWHETLRLTTPPRDPIPYVGIGDQEHGVWLDDYNCTQEITESTQSLSFSAYKIGDTPVSWEWQLVFPHEYGYAVVESWTTNSTEDDLTWNISNFSLPSGYDWEYTYDGKIAGRVEVVCLDPDYHDDAINVIYVPNDLYPGTLVYENQIVTNNQPDVDVHELLIVRNDVFGAGANISFKAGERIDIEDGVTIENGSLTNFIIDPSLR
ncbi:MAG: hypothetical protein GF344_00460 [Chitinivibrionales bacterium]|nr:hypothetical protein [Chitinivibrionales bacterium]MBD3355597.1 hypothetical protein [Chitinivibrionales bacterium]